METNNQGSTSLIVASLGWILLVVAVVLFFLVGQPHFYRQGYTQGQQDQRVSDVQVFDDAFGIPAIDDPVTPVNVKVTGIDGNSLMANLDTGTPNPFDKDLDRSWKILIDEETELTKRVPLLRAEVEELLQQAADSGGSIAYVEPFEDFPLLVDELRVGDSLQVFARYGADKVNDEFVASEVILFVAPPTPNNV